MNALLRWQGQVDALGLIAILRGLQPEEAIGIVQSLVDSGFGIVEVPLNSPQPFDSITRLRNHFGDDLIIGAGTVLSDRQAVDALNAGAELIVAPNFNKGVADSAVQGGAIYCPGVASPTEAFNALAAGAHALKLFPAEIITPSVVKAMHAVLPDNTLTIPVGGIDTENMATYLNAGAGAFGIGSSLYKPGRPATDVQDRAKQLIGAFRSAESSLG